MHRPRTPSASLLSEAPSPGTPGMVEWNSGCHRGAKEGTVEAVEAAGVLLHHPFFTGHLNLLK